MAIFISTIDAREDFSELLNRVQLDKERAILTRRGKEVAAIVPIEDLRLLLQSDNKGDLQDAMEALQEARDIGAILLENLKQEIGL